MWLKKIVAKWRGRAIVCLALALGAGIGLSTAFALDMQHRRDHFVIGLTLAGALVIYLDFFMKRSSKTKDEILGPLDLIFQISGVVADAALLVGIITSIIKCFVSL